MDTHTQFAQDIAFLERNRLLGYSLLVGIHRRKPAPQTTEPPSSTTHHPGYAPSTTSYAPSTMSHAPSTPSFAPSFTSHRPSTTSYGLHDRHTDGLQSIASANPDTIVTGADSDCHSTLPENAQRSPGSRNRVPGLPSLPRAGDGSHRGNFPGDSARSGGACTSANTQCPPVLSLTPGLSPRDVCYSEEFGVSAQVVMSAQDSQRLLEKREQELKAMYRSSFAIESGCLPNVGHIHAACLHCTRAYNVK
jgi:hypothetical protein